MCPDEDDRPSAPGLACQTCCQLDTLMVAKAECHQHKSCVADPFDDLRVDINWGLKVSTMGIDGQQSHGGLGVSLQPIDDLTPAGAESDHEGVVG